MDTKKLVYIGFAFSHHKGTHAGYHHIKDYLQYDYVIDCESFVQKCQYRNSIFSRIWSFIMRKMFGYPIFPYYILKCILLGILHDNNVFHFIYTENTYVNFRRFIRKGNKIVCTIHQPVEWFVRYKWEKKLRSIDRIILVGESEIDQFRAITGKYNVVFIPHGIDTSFYCPKEISKKEKMLLTIGNWLRDYGFANQVYHRLLSEDSELHVVIVSSVSNKAFITPHERISFLSGISDEELHNLYIRSSVLYLPLIRYTANNSLLEAAACGCNIVISSDFPDNSYIPSDYLLLCPMDVDCVVDLIKRNYQYGFNTSLARYVDKHYSWETIGRDTKSLIMSL